MKKLTLLLALCCSLLLLYGCSEDSQVVNPSSDQADLGQLVERPAFVDTRPASLIASAIKPGLPLSQVSKPKPPPPPPDTGGTGDPLPNPAHKYAYIVGISDYEGTANDLQFCDDDANEMRSYLQSQGFTIQMDLDRNATAAEVEAGLNWLMSVAAPGDEIAFFYSGHAAKATGYGSSLISTDMYYLTHGWVMQKLNAANCTKKTIAMDACVLGDFHADVTDGMLLATASTNTYSYDAPDLNNGAWTYYYLKGATTEGLIYGEDIATYAEQGMIAWAKAHRLRVSPAHTDMYTGMLDI